MEFTVGNLDFRIKPKKGDNLRLLDIQTKAGKDTAKLMKDFVPYISEIIAREEDLAKDDPARQELETFVEAHVMDMFKEVMIGFRWTTREKLEEAEANQASNFQEAVLGQ